MRQFSKAHFDLLLPGATYAVLLLLHHVTQYVDTGEPEPALPPLLASSPVVTFRSLDYLSIFRWLIATAPKNWRSAISLTVEKAIQQGRESQLALAASDLKEYGDQVLEAAFKTEGRREFYDGIFHALPSLYAARWLYDMLANSTAVRDPQAKAVYQREAMKGCEEKVVRILGSLFNAVHDLDWSMLNRHRETVLRVWNEKGFLAAERMLTEIFELHYFYPRAFKQHFR